MLASLVANANQIRIDMRTFKRIAIGIILSFALLLLIFLVPAFLKPNVTHTSRVTIEKPANEVWQKFMNPDNTGKWLEGFERFEPVSGTPESKGSKQKIFLTINGREESAVETIIEIEPNKKFAFNLDSDRFQNEITISLTSNGGSTEFVQTEVASGKGVLMRALIYWVSDEMFKISQKNLENLKKFIEESN